MTRHRLLRLLVVLLLLILATHGGIAQVKAQGAAIASYELQLYLPGVDAVAGAPFSVSTIPLTAVTCNQTPLPVPTTTLTNPRFLVWTDPANVGKECRVDRSAYLLALPAGAAYRATLVALAGTATEQRSARSAPTVPFALAAVAPAAPEGLGLRP